MRNMRNVFCLTAILILLFSLPGSAQRYWRTQTPYDLNLTEEQLVKIQEVRLEFQKETLDLRTRFHSLYLELEMLYLKKAGQETIDAKIAQMNSIDLELEELFQTHLLNISGLLTKEQQVIYDRFGGLGLGQGQYGGMGLGYGRDMGVGRGAGRGRGIGLGYGRGYGMGQRVGNSRVPGRGLYANPALGRGIRCPNFYYWQRGYDRLRDWR